MTFMTYTLLFLSRQKISY